MRISYLFFIAAFLVSCKGSFIKRKYMDGYFVSRTASVNSRILDEKVSHFKKEELEEVETVVAKHQRPNFDTIILNTGERIACRVETISRKQITYSKQNHVGNKLIIRNKKVLRIHFEGNKREYFTQVSPSGNPLLQFNLIKQLHHPKIGISAFGYVVLLFVGIGLTAVSIGFLPLLLLFLGLLVGLTIMDRKTIGFKIMNGFGKFIGYTALGLLAFMIIILLIVIIALL